MTLVQLSSLGVTKFSSQFNSAELSWYFRHCARCWESKIRSWYYSEGDPLAVFLLLLMFLVFLPPLLFKEFSPIGSSLLCTHSKFHHCQSVLLNTEAWIFIPLLKMLNGGGVDPSLIGIMLFFLGVWTLMWLWRFRQKVVQSSLLAFWLTLGQEGIDLGVLSIKGKPRGRREPLKPDKIRRHEEDAGSLI